MRQKAISINARAVTCARAAKDLAGTVKAWKESRRQTGVMSNHCRGHARSRSKPVLDTVATNAARTVA